MFDILIRGGRVVDGSGAEAFLADVAVKDGLVVAMGDLGDAAAATLIDASGKIVTPGFIDIHTHYDGQVTWDDTLDPSFSHGVTTIVMGNCGVGFAPVRKGQEEQLIELMEGVEDIPGSVLSEGIEWSWESFPEYLEVLSRKKWTMDVAAMVPHSALRTYVMGDRGFRNEDARREDIDAMADLIADAIDAGAVGFSTSRINSHMSLSGESVPGTYAEDAELLSIGLAMKGSGSVFEMVPGGLEGKDPFSHDEFRKMDPETGELSRAEASYEHELALMSQISREANLPVTFLFSQSKRQPDRHAKVMEFVAEQNRLGAQIRPQVNPRPVGILASFQSFHMFQRRSTYLSLAGLSLDQRIAELRKQEVKLAILSDEDVPASTNGGFTDNLHAFLAQHITEAFPMGCPINFEPTPEQAIVARATRRGVSAEEEIYHLMLEQDGRAIVFYALSNYVDRNFDELRKLLVDDATIVGGSDGGAHVRYICDAALPSFALKHWVRDRDRGQRIALEAMVKMLTSDNAKMFGFDDRGTLHEGTRADINVIDLERLELLQPFPVNDLPANGTRLLQKSKGYLATIVNGVVTRRNDEDTGMRPGRLLRGKKISVPVSNA